MTGYDLRLWRKSLGWSRDRAAAELDVSLRTYKSYENSKHLKRHIELATVTLSLCDLLPLFQKGKMRQQRIVELLQAMTSEVMISPPAQTTL